MIGRFHRLEALFYNRDDRYRLGRIDRRNTGFEEADERPSEQPEIIGVRFQHVRLTGCIADRQRKGASPAEMMDLGVTAPAESDQPRRRMPGPSSETIGSIWWIE